MKRIPTPIRYIAVGAVGTLAHYGVLIVLVQSLGVRAVPASSAGFAVGALVNYALNYRFTFQSRKRHREALSKFMLIALAGLVVNSTIMVLGGRCGLHYLVTQVIATGTVLAGGFIGNLLWTFGRQQHEISNN